MSKLHSILYWIVLAACITR